MKLLTARGHMLFGILWTIGMLVIVIGFSGVGGLAYSPWILLLLPFIATRVALLRNESREGRSFPRAVQIAGATTELIMLTIFIYLYNLSVLSYCPPPT